MELWEIDSRSTRTNNPAYKKLIDAETELILFCSATAKNIILLAQRTGHTQANIHDQIRIWIHMLTEKGIKFEEGADGNDVEVG